MKNLERLLEKYLADARIQRIGQALAGPAPARLQMEGLAGALDSVLIASVFKNLAGKHLVIAHNKEEAAYVQNDLNSLLASQTVHFLPDSFKRPGYFQELNNNQVQQRTEIMHQVALSGASPELIVTYPEALFEMVVSPGILEKNKLELTVGEKLDVDFMIATLLEYGFNREDFVYEPGQFSIRGGIIDLFSFANEDPYRIELDDDLVESIRIFEPLTQLSKRSLSRLAIIPNINTRFRQDQKVSLLDVLPEKSVVWIYDYPSLIDKVQDCFENAIQFIENTSALDESERAEMMRDRAFLRPNQIAGGLNPFHLVFLGDPGSEYKPGAALAFKSKPQPSFNKNFELLIQALQDNAQKGIETFIFTDSARQIERFYAIFEDLGAQATFHPVIAALRGGFVDPERRVAAFTDHQIFQRFHRYRLKQGYTKEKALNVRLLRELQSGDYVTHIDHGVGRYSGLEKITVGGQVQESVRLIYKNNDILYVGINSLHKISKFVGKEGTEPVLSKLGSDAWKTLKARTKKKVKDIAAELIKLYAQRKAAPGYAFAPDGYLQNELEASFIYEDTPDQLKATNDVKEDMTKPHPMDRLICGDVGFGKTEVAIRAAFKSVSEGKQVAVLVPTTILALQHYKTFSERLADFNIKVDYINRFRSAKEKKAILERLRSGDLELVIGTHALLGKEVVFKDLGLLIIDEEQKFGVTAKERLRNLKVNVDTLTLTATPIPRTLQFSLMAARDLSIIRTPPPNRQPIHTEVRVMNDQLVKEAIYYEVNRGGQVFFVHNRVKNLGEMAGMIQALCPDVEIAIAHGQMESENLEETLINFIEGRYDVLVCTNIIETGLDIPNANTIIINNSHQFGMSDLHQLRGRVGRSNQKAFCYLLSPPVSVLTNDARKRLRTLEEFSDLGSGFQIAMRDLDIRGAGNLLGAEQSGFINDIGFETYQRILEEAIQELKETDFKDLFREGNEKNRQFVRDVQIDTDTEMHIPDEYVENIQERLNLYTELDGIETEEELAAFEERLRDRFGKLPWQVYELFNGLRLRWVCKQYGLERISLKGNKLRCYFIENPQSPFYDGPTFQGILDWVAKHGRMIGLTLKQLPKSLLLVKDGVRSLEEARELLGRIKL